MEILTEIQYLPPVSYFVRLGAFHGLILEGWEHYQKQSYRNRCHILGANKVAELNIPVRKTAQKMLIRDAEIDYDQKWLPVHWRTICSAYGKAPFFEYYEELFRNIFFKKHKFLFDLNMELLQLILKLIDWKKEVRISERYSDSDGFKLIMCLMEGGRCIRRFRAAKRERFDLPDIPNCLAKILWKT